MNVANIWYQYISSWFYSCMDWEGFVLFMPETMWKSGTIKWIYWTICRVLSMLCSILSHFWYRQYLNCFQKPMQQIYSTKIKWKSKNLTFGNMKRRYVWSFLLTKTKIRTHFLSWYRCNVTFVDFVFSKIIYPNARKHPHARYYGIYVRVYVPG